MDTPTMVDHEIDASDEGSEALKGDDARSGD
jgi:hypothetical protein